MSFWIFRVFTYHGALMQKEMKSSGKDSTLHKVNFNLTTEEYF